MSSSMLVYEPVAPCLTELRESRQSLDSLAGKVIGFIDNSKPNFEHLADDLAELLVSKYEVARIMRHRKRSPAHAAPDDIINELTAECDAIITGSGD